MQASQQTELDFDAMREESARLEERLSGLLVVLQERAGWMTRRELETVGFDERELRTLCEYDAEGRVFSYPGSPGYKLFDLVTDQEFDKAVALKHQGEKMVAKWLRYQRRWHRRFKATEGAAGEV